MKLSSSASPCIGIPMSVVYDISLLDEEFFRLVFASISCGRKQKSPTALLLV